jgi:hypothetical protein
VRVARPRRRVIATVLALAVLLAVPALASTTGSANVIDALGRQLLAVEKKTTVPVLLPSTLPFAGKVPKLYPAGTGSKNAWSLDLSGAPNCGRANACFLASFEGKRGGSLPGKPNLRLAGGRPAFYKGITCGGSCGPATLWFVYRGVLYTWQHKDPPANTKAVLARLAVQAIVAGPR